MPTATFVTFPFSLTRFQYTPEEDTMCFDAENRRATSYATGAGETPIGHFANEYTFFLWFDESGEKLTRIDEFVDSGYTTQFFERLLGVVAQGDKSEVVREWKKKYGIA